MFMYLLPFLFLFALVLVGGSIYFCISEWIQNRPPEPVEYTVINRIDFDRRF